MRKVRHVLRRFTCNLREKWTFLRFHASIRIMADNNQDYYNTLVDSVIEAYRKLLNQGMALDVCRVQGKMRAMILRDGRFIAETRAIRAEKYLRELNEIEDIYTAATRLGDDDSYDGSGRDSARKAKGKNSDKDALAMQLKAAAMRRELMSLTANDTGDNEESSINFFFTALTAEEMEHMKQIEVNHGTASDADTFKGMNADSTSDVAAQAKKRKQQTKDRLLPASDGEPSEDDIFEELPDGTLRIKE